MCGISGIVSNNPNNLSYSKLKLMTNSIAHRGPDGEGLWIGKTGKVGLGHRRLSIIDLSDLGKQPMHYLNRYTITLNGEIYNYIELRAVLIKEGYQFNSQSDTEVLLALYDLKKELCLNEIDGMFAFAIWDEQEQVLFCARDRFGEKPFFYFQDNETFYFASEMKALWAAGIKKVPSVRRVYFYLAYGAQDDLQNPSTTFFNDIFQLEPAHYFFLKNNKILNKSKYWDINLNIRDNSISVDNAREKFYDLFCNSIQKRLRSDVPIGSSLSGGLDSSSIVSIIDKIKTKNQIQKTFSARFEGFAKDEGKYIDIVTEKCNVYANQVFLTSEILNENLDEVMYHQEEPFGSTSIMAQWNVMKLARENNVTVLLDGQGADEMLAGYPAYFYNYFCSLFLHNKSEFKYQRKKYLELYGTQINLGKWISIHANFPNLRNQMRIVKNSIKTPEYLSHFNPDFLEECKTFSFNYEISTDLNKSLYHSTMNGGLTNLLRFADRNSMAHSREIRLPFLNHHLVEFIFSLPDNFKLYNGWTKFILRETMKDILPENICWRKEKVGFEPPNYKFLDKERAEAAIEVLNENKVIRKNKRLRNVDWEYYQVSKLYAK